MECVRMWKAYYIIDNENYSNEAKPVCLSPNLQLKNVLDNEVLAYVQRLNDLHADFETRFKDILAMETPYWIIDPYGDIEESVARIGGTACLIITIELHAIYHLPFATCSPTNFEYPRAWNCSATVAQLAGGTLAEEFEEAEEEEAEEGEAEDDDDGEEAAAAPGSNVSISENASPNDRIQAIVVRLLNRFYRRRRCPPYPYF
ncbi:hypothetical protein Trydic_g10937 [Trypoxylus dichotomus]